MSRPPARSSGPPLILPLVNRIAATGLPTRGSALPEVPLPARAWDALLSDCRRERVQSWLAGAIRGGMLAATAHQSHAASAELRAALHWVLLLEQLTLRVTDDLTAAGMEPRVLKGAAVAHSLYSAPAMRLFNDVDVLLRSDDFTRAVRRMQDQGFHRVLPELRPGFDERFAKTVLLRDHLGRELDLHRTLVVGPFGQRVRTDELFDGAEPVVVGGRTILGLAPPQSLVALCYHAALGDLPPRLVPQRDVVEAVLRTAVPHRDLIALAASWGGQVVLARAVATAWERLGIIADHPLAAWAASYRPSARERVDLAVYRPRSTAAPWKAVATAAAVPGGAREKLSYARAVLLPARDFLRQRGMARWRWWFKSARRASRRTLGLERRS